MVKRQEIFLQLWPEDSPDGEEESLVVGVLVPPWTLQGPPSLCFIREGDLSPPHGGDSFWLGGTQEIFPNITKKILQRIHATFSLSTTCKKGGRISWAWPFYNLGLTWERGWELKGATEPRHLPQVFSNDPIWKGIEKDLSIKQFFES